MERKRRSRRSAGLPTQVSSSSTGLTFPAALIHPPQSQFARSEDAVSDRINRLELYALKLAEGFGISFTTFELNPLQGPIDESGVAALVAVLGAFARREERVSLERKGGKWGLYYTREPAVISPQERRSETVPIKDASLDVRERFLLKSEQFFREYLDLCKERLGRMHGSVASADRTLHLLADMRLE